MFFSPPQGGMHVSFHRMPSHQSGFRTASLHHIIPRQKRRKSPLNNRQRKKRAERASFLMTPDSSEQRLTSAYQASAAWALICPAVANLGSASRIGLCCKRWCDFSPPPSHSLQSSPAMLLLLFTQVIIFLYAATQNSYWAYLPDPPLFHVAPWEFSLVKVRRK